MSDNYDDIINLPHHVSTKHLPMSMYDRASQFAPYAALTGYGDEVKETARLTDNWIDLDGDIKAYLDEALQNIVKKIVEKPEITVTYFVKDSKKEGGEYVSVVGKLRRIDEVNQQLILENGKIINIQSIIDLVEN
ncbi:hypothetical protein IKE96_03370 [bacterium]|nr:hypothetical protein [bacterium]